jgi:hypothetical protein
MMLESAGIEVIKDITPQPGQPSFIKGEEAADCYDGFLTQRTRRTQSEKPKGKLWTLDLGPWTLDLGLSYPFAFILHPS